MLIDIVNTNIDINRVYYYLIFIFYVNYSYSSMYAYGQTKLANILHANELTRRLKVCVILNF